MSKNKNNFIPPKKQQKQDTKKPIFWVLFFLIIFWTVSGILGVCSFIGLSPSSDNTLTVKADEVITTPQYTYEGNNYFVPTSITFYDGYNPETQTIDLTPQYDFLKYFLSVDTLLTTELYSNNDYANLGVSYVPRLKFRMYGSNKRSYLSAYRIDGDYTETYRYDDTGYFSLPLLSEYSQADLVDGVRVPRDTQSFYLFEGSSFEYENFIGYVETDTSTIFNCNVQTITFSSRIISPNWTSRHIVNEVTYRDNNSNTCVVSFHLWINSHPNYSGVSQWENRTYWISNEIMQDNIFQSGKDYGYQLGKNDYLNSGFQDGYDRGKADGKSEGYNDGLLDANKYSFLGLMTAVVDAPIQALTGLFGFELLGVNLMSVISGLFTVCVILVLLRLLLGGGLSG